MISERELCQEGIADTEEDNPAANTNPEPSEGSNPPEGQIASELPELSPAPHQNEQPQGTAIPRTAPPTPRFFTSNSERKFSKQKTKKVTPAVTDPSGPPTNTQKHTEQASHTFSRPKPGDFSHQRRKPDINALRRILESLDK